MDQGVSRRKVITYTIIVFSVIVICFACLFLSKMLRKKISGGDASSAPSETEAIVTETLQTKTGDDPDVIVIEIQDAQKARIEGKKNSPDVGRSYYEEGKLEDELLAAYKDRPLSDFPQDNVANCPDHLECREIQGSKVYYATSKDHPDEYSRNILIIHGGAYLMDITYRDSFREMVDWCDARLCIPLFQPVFGGTYKEAYDLILEVYKDVLEDDHELVLVGDSSGGGLALGFVEYIQTLGMELPDKIVLNCPWLDVTLSNPEVPNYEERDILLGTYGLRILGEMWAGDLDPKDYRISPIYGEIHDLPKTLILTGTEEIFYPDVMDLYSRMKEGGMDVRLIYGEGLYHFYSEWNTPEGYTARRLIAQFINGDL